MSTSQTPPADQAAIFKALRERYDSATKHFTAGLADLTEVIAMMDDPHIIACLKSRAAAHLRRCPSSGLFPQLSPEDGAAREVESDRAELPHLRWAMQQLLIHMTSALETWSSSDVILVE